LTDEGSITEARAALLDQLGYRFRDESLIDEALTHPSMAVIDPGRSHYQRLEFLGDRVLGLVIADSLFSLVDDEREGLLTRRYAECVENAALARVARDLGIGPALRVQPNTNLAETDKVLADALEAMIGAIWRDGGMAAVRPVILSIWGNLMETCSTRKDSKSALQEYALERKMGLPVYEVVDRSGPDHAPQFVIAVSLGEWRLEAKGASKRQAEQQAASLMLEEIR
jgi:ribonuclease-3